MACQNISYKDVVSLIEEKCRTMTFEEALQDFPTWRAAMQTSISLIIQTRIDFDQLQKLDFARLTPYQLRSMSEHKRTLLRILHGVNDEDLPSIDD